MSVNVLKPGLLSTLQDGGRPGHAALGVGRAGAMDLPAWRLANALVGNTGGEAALEFTLLGPSLRFEQPAVVALTGAAAEAQADGLPLPFWTCCRLPAGTVLSIGGMAQGLSRLPRRSRRIRFRTGTGQPQLRPACPARTRAARRRRTEAGHRRAAARHALRRHPDLAELAPRRRGLVR
jgi:hypothetical protein